MNKEDKATLSAIYKKYQLREYLKVLAINNDLDFDNRRDFYITLTRSELLNDGKDYCTIHTNLYKVNKRGAKRPVYPDDFTLIE